MSGNFSDCSDLDRLLRLWLAPNIRTDLDYRVARSFRSYRKSSLVSFAIASPRLIKFRPATKDRRPVNVSMQLEYNFNLAPANGACL